MRKNFFKAGYIALSFTAVAVLAAGCQPGEGEEEGTAAAPSAASPSAAAPSPTAAPNTKEVCAAVLNVFLDASVKIGEDSVKVIEDGLTLAQQEGQLKATLSTLAGQLKVQAEKANDPEIKALVEKMATDTESGAKSADPVTWLDKLPQVGSTIDKECVA